KNEQILFCPSARKFVEGSNANWKQHYSFSSNYNLSNSISALARVGGSTGWQTTPLLDQIPEVSRTCLFAEGGDRNLSNYNLRGMVKAVFCSVNPNAVSVSYDKLWKDRHFDGSNY